MKTPMFALAAFAVLAIGPLLLASAAQQLPEGAEAMSLFGEPLYPPAPSAEARQTLEARLAEAQADYEKQPENADAIIWLGRRMAYLGRYRDSIAVYTKGLDRHPADARFYRHRGHRHITIRELDRAIADLEKAASLVEGRPDEVEPDGLPNARNIPTSTLHTNIWYHLGLAYYLTGDLDQALRAYEACMRASKNADMQVATAHWLYMTLRRLGRDEEARAVLEPIHPGMDIIENDAYHQLLLMYKGLDPPEAVFEKATAGGGIGLPTLGYGVGNWHLYNGRRDAAVDVFRQILQKSDQWAAFGYLAAEADLQRLGLAP